MEPNIEPGRPEDAPTAARLITETDADLFRLLAGELETWEELAAWEWRHERGIYGHPRTWVARGGDDIEGVLVGYAGRDHINDIDWSLGCSRHQMSPQRFEQIDRMRGVAFYLFPAIPDDAFYVQNIAVAESRRGAGLGRRLMALACERARAQGCQSLHLDVDATTRAVGFYSGLGMRVLVRTSVPALGEAHEHLRMVLDL